MTSERFRPYKLGPAHRAQSAVNTRWTESSGWRVPATFGDPEREADQIRNAGGLQDVSSIGKLDIKGTAAEAHLGRCEQIEEVIAVLRVKPGHAVVLTEAGHEDCVRQALETGCDQAAGCIHVTDTTAGLAAFALVGPQALEVLSRLTALDVRDDRFRDRASMRGSLAQAHATIHRQDWGDLRRYLILVGRELGEYVWETMRATGERLGLTPFGVDAERLILDAATADREQSETVRLVIPA